MEAPDIFAGYGNITDVGLTDLGFHVDDLLNISNEEIAGPIGDDDSSGDNTKWAGDETDNSSTQRCRSPLHANYKHYALTCSDDLAELEWLSNFVEDSLSMDSGAPKPPERPPPPNNSNEEIGSSAGPEMCSGAVPVRARSKRLRRPPVGNWYNSHVLLFSPRRSPSGLEMKGRPNGNSSGNGPKDQCSGAEMAVPAKKLKRTRDEKGQASRRCMHCAIQRTPQWRAGPSGPKTLCNACGVRYKSGRLFPEYRPAASPTFVTSQHSNSHKRVLQIRRQKLESPVREELPGKGRGFHSPPLRSRPYPFPRPNYAVIDM